MFLKTKDDFRLNYKNYKNKKALRAFFGRISGDKSAFGPSARRDRSPCLPYCPL